MYAYVFSLALLLGSFSQMGLDGLIVREVINKPNYHSETMATALGLRFGAAVVIAFGIIAYGYAIESHTDEERLLFQAAAGVVAAGPVGAVIGCWYKAQLQSMYPSVDNILGAVLGGGLKICVTGLGLGVAWIGVGQLLSTFAASVVLLALYLRLDGPSLSPARASLGRAKEMLGESWKLLLGSTFSMVYKQIDITMLRFLVGSSAAGEYAVAIRVVMLTTIFAGALSTTIFPSLVRACSEPDLERYWMLIKGTFALLFAASYVLSAGIFPLGPTTFVLAFEAEYAAAGKLLPWTALLLPFAFARMAITRWVLVEGKGNFLIISEAVGATANIALNFTLIPSMGTSGALASTVAAFILTTLFCPLVSSSSRTLSLQMLRAMVNPISPSLWMLRNKKRA